MKAASKRAIAAFAEWMFKTIAAIIAPCSVNTCGKCLLPPRPTFDLAICEVKDSVSSTVSRKTKSGGNRWRFRRLPLLLHMQNIS